MNYIAVRDVSGSASRTVNKGDLQSPFLHEILFLIALLRITNPHYLWFGMPFGTSRTAGAFLPNACYKPFFLLSSLFRCPSKTAFNIIFVSPISHKSKKSY